jgi:hypothetical protein
MFIYRIGRQITRSIVILVCAVTVAAALRSPQWSDLPAPARVLAGQLGINAANFGETIAAIDKRTAERLRDGEWDELIFYVLQSRSFTAADPIEPARSAAQFIPMKPRRIPADVQERMDAFLAAAASNERLKYFATLKPTRTDLELQYGRAMEFLYAKEVRCRENDHPQACIAELYTSRGLSSDTSMQAFRIVQAAAPWIGKPKRVLILGPGVDFAPRTALKENGPPHVYQPAQVKALFQPERVDCVDVNPLVLVYARSECASVYELNIATGFVDGSYDLIIATNILLYLDDRELLLAIGNVRRMLSPEGIFLHNDARFAVNVFGKACGLPVVRFENVDLKPPLTDRYVLHRASAI